MIITPLIMLPNRRTAKRQRARDFADDIERQHDECGLRIGFQIAAPALLPMPNSGTATNTHRASAAVVESEPVGGLITGNHRHEAGRGNEQEERAEKARDTLPADPGRLP